MANATTILPTKQYQRWRVQPKMSFKNYRDAWLTLEQIGQKVNRLWKIKKNSFEVLQEERQ